jgi:hypothetical protein
LSIKEFLTHGRIRPALSRLAENILSPGSNNSDVRAAESGAGWAEKKKNSQIECDFALSHIRVGCLSLRF